QFRAARWQLNSWPALWTRTTADRPSSQASALKLKEIGKCDLDPVDLAWPTVRISDEAAAAANIKPRPACLDNRRVDDLTTHGEITSHARSNGANSLAPSGSL